MEALIAMLSLYVAIYAGFIIALSRGFSKVKQFESQGIAPITTFSIIIPFRNEEKNLPRLLSSLALLDYPKELFELIFIDDFSDDFSVNVINKWRMQNGRFHTTILENLRLSASPKKDAISRAVPIIENQWIVTTDADCIVPNRWLTELNAYIVSTNAAMIAAPVAYDGDRNLQHHFERLDMLSLQGATIGGFGIGNPFMCNGANFAYTKKLFLQLGGFGGNNQIASGDDVFLLQKAVAVNPEIVHYLKSTKAIVHTNPSGSWRQLLHQRIRWASKSGSYESAFATDLGLVVAFANLSVVIAVLLAIFETIRWEIAIVLFIIKCIPDFILLIQANRLLRGGKYFMPLLSAVIYPFFCVVVAFYALLGKYKWKGRKYSH